MVKYEQMKNIINGIVENELIHIHILEKDFTDTDIQYQQHRLVTEIIHKALEKSITEEQKRLIGELEDSISNEWMEVCKFYFKEGLKAGLSSLKFLNEIDNSYLMIE